VTSSIDILDPAKPKHVAILASNPAVSPVTGWTVGFWWAELVHPYWGADRAWLRGRYLQPRWGRARRRCLVGSTGRVRLLGG